MRHINNLIIAQADDKTQAYKLATSWIIDKGLTSQPTPDGANTVSIRSLDNPDYYIRIMNGFSVVLQQLNYTDPTFTIDATFIVRNGLADPNQVSFELLNQPGYFLRQFQDQVVAATV